MVTNPKSISWVNPTTGTDQSGNTVSWDANTDLAGIEIQLDSVPAVSVPVSTGANSFNLRTLSAYLSLPAGQHNVGMAVVTKEGAVSSFTSAVTFQVAVVPAAPTSLVVA